MEGRNKEIIEEVLDEINSALNDSRGLLVHQRRLAFSLSLGTASLIEIYLENKNVMKPGGKINHLWLKKKDENVKNLISTQITCPIENLKDLNGVLNIAFKIEDKRNDLAYGPPAQEKVLRNLISLFLDMKKEVEND